MGCMELSSSTCAEIGVPIYLSCVSQGISLVARGSQATCRVCWGQGIGLEPMQGNRA